MTPIIVVADKMENEVIAKLRTLGHVEFQPADLKAALHDADVLIVRSATTVSEELLASAPKLKIVARAGVGLDNVDRAACEKRKITVINTPNASTNAVAELAIGNLIALMRNSGRAHAALREGKWVKADCVGREIAGKTIGIVGMGRIGRAVAEKAQSLGMSVAYTDLRQAEGLHYRFVPTLAELLPQVNVISLHASAAKGAAALMGAAEFKLMKKGSYLVNAARGALVDENALLDALKSGQLAGAALDVYVKEPKKAGEPLPDGIAQLAKMDNVLLTPHIGASTHEAQARIGADLIEQLKKLLK